jgi:RNA polymerase sigma factor (sigma-70 family)
MTSMQRRKFHPRATDALQRLSDDELVAYICVARDAGDLNAMRDALTVLAWGNMAKIVARMRLRVPAEAAEEVALEAFEKAAMGAFRGESAGQFHSWLNKIILGVSSDWLRRMYNQREHLEPLGAGEESGSRLEPSVASESGAVELRLVTDEVLAQLSDHHRRVVEMHVFEGLSAPEVCERLDGMSPDNVAKIASRFRQRMRQALEGGT